MNLFSNAFIFHGTAGLPEGNWFPWLKAELEQRGVPTVVPCFPTPEGESLQAWLDVVGGQQQKITERSLLVGHSKGGMFLLKLLELLDVQVEAALLISTPVGERPIRYYEEDKKFSNFAFNWAAIRNKARHFAVLHSDNDPYVSMANGERLAKELGVDLTFIPQAGHLNAESGYTRLPQLLAIIDSLR